MREGDIIQQTTGGPVTIDTLKADLTALGVEPGMTLLVHSSLSALGWVCGGPVAVLQALEELLGPQGTLVMPTHTNYLSDPATWHHPPVPQTWWETIRQTMPPYQPDLTPSRGMGAVPECFRKQNGVWRSGHPHFSFAAWGAHAQAITAPQPLDFGLGEESPLARIYNLDGRVLLLGVGHNSNTSLHLAEYRANTPTRQVVAVGLPLMENGRHRWSEFRDIQLDESDFAEIGAHFNRDCGLVRQGQVGQATAMLMPQRTLVDFAVGWMERHRQPAGHVDPLFERLVSEAAQQDFTGWDFSFIARRCVQQKLPWDYREKVRQKLNQADSLLDIGTGGGEFLASLGALPRRTWATEGYQPNIPLARSRLAPLRVRVLESETIGRLPLEAAAFDLVINRHAVFTAAELHRILKPGGLFITQQVGGHNEQQLNQLLHADLNPQIAGWNLAAAVQQLETAGFEIVEQHETYPETVFYDIGAVVYYLKAVPWQIPGFSVDTYYDHLLALHHTIQASGGITVTGHRFFIEARRAD